RVHDDAAVVRSEAEPARATGFADRDVRVLDVRDLSDRRVAVEVHLANLAARQADLRVVAVLRHERRSRAGRTNELRAASLLELDVVNRGPERDVAKAERVAGLDVGVLVADDRVAGVEAVGREDERLLAVRVVKERDARGAVRIVLDARDLRG